MKHLLAIIGSPRPQGNTASILRRFAESAPQGFDVEVIFLSDYAVGGCSGCGVCQTRLADYACTQKDEAALLLEKIVRADGVIYGSPLYGHNFSGQLKIFLDRHLPLFKFVEGGDKAVDEMKIVSFIEQKPVALAVSCQGPAENNGELIQALFDKFCESSLAQCVGKYIFPFCNPQAAQSDDNAALLEKMWADMQFAIQK